MTTGSDRPIFVNIAHHHKAYTSVVLLGTRVLSVLEDIGVLGYLGYLSPCVCRQCAVSIRVALGLGVIALGMLHQHKRAQITTALSPNTSAWLRVCPP